MKKRFDCVAFQRKIRNELSREYLANKEKFQKKLNEKYQHLHRSKISPALKK